MTPPVLAALRERTAAHHERLEAGLDLLATEHTRATYRQLLERFHGFCVPAEEGVDTVGAWSALGLDGAARGKTARLAADLRALGHDAASIGRLPLCPHPPSFPTAAEAVGYLYVMEGATLGGAVISRRLARTLGVTREDGGAFFGSYGADVGPMWKGFVAALGRFAQRPGVTDRVVAGACESFGGLETWLLSR